MRDPTPPPSSYVIAGREVLLGVNFPCLPPLQLIICYLSK